MHAGKFALNQAAVVCVVFCDSARCDWMESNAWYRSSGVLRYRHGVYFTIFIWQPTAWFCKCRKVTSSHCYLPTIVPRAHMLEPLSRILPQY